jgi:DNA-binding transcriptional LysR family regulator
MKGISLELYRIFWEIGKTQNITRAAENLFVTQPNISAALRTLEDRLHATLCVRSKKGISLTYEGQTLFNELEEAFSHITLAETKIEKLIHLESGTISISASDTICSYYLLPFIAAFTKRYPGIRLEISNRTSLETAELVKSGSVDFGFVNLPCRDASLVTTVCSDVHDILIGGSEYESLSRSVLPISALSGYPLVMLERKSVSRLSQDRFFEEAGIALAPVLELGSLDLVVSFVRSNMGLAFIPKELCGRFVDRQAIFEIVLDRPLPVRGIGIVELKGSVRSTASEQFIRTVLEHE